MCIEASSLRCIHRGLAPAKSETRAPHNKATGTVTVLSLFWMRSNTRGRCRWAPATDFSAL